MDVDPGLTVDEAATRLSKHPKTIRQWIKLGKLAAVQIQGPHGPEWRVYPDGLPASVQAPLTVPEPPAQPEPSDVTALVALVDKYHDEAMRQTAAAAHWQARYLDAEARHQAAEERIKLLTAEPDPEPDPEPSPPSPPRRSWWRKWWS